MSEIYKNAQVWNDAIAASQDPSPPSQVTPPNEICVAVPEREALLQQVALAWPYKEHVTHGASYVLLSHPDQTYNARTRVLTLTNDHNDAEALMLMWDEMEKARWIVGLENFHLNDVPFPFFCHWRRDPYKQHLPDEYCFAKTRAECIVRAFIACFQTAEVSPTNTSRSSDEDLLSGEEK